MFETSEYLNINKIKENQSRIIEFEIKDPNEQQKKAFEIINLIKGIKNENDEKKKEEEKNIEAFIVGGAVRDYLREKKPNDLDICTSAQPEEIEKSFSDLPNYSCFYVGKSKENKIINIKYKDENSEYIFEVATFRKDVYLDEKDSERIKRIENKGFIKRLIEFETDYENLKNEFEDDDKYKLSFATEEDVKNILEEEYNFTCTNNDGIFLINSEGEDYEIAFFKIESKQKDDKDDSSEVKENENEKKKNQKTVYGRHPDFVITKNVTASEDALRRDFTMNGIFYDPVEKKIIDYVGGFEDIENNIIRFIDDPDERIEQDKIRILRFFRFKGIMGFKSDERSLEAVRQWLKEDEKRDEFKKQFELNQRIKPEFEKILKSNRRIEILQDMLDEGALEFMIPQIVKMKGVEQPKEFHREGDVWEHTKECLKNLPENASLELIWATLLHDVGKSDTQETPEKDGTDRIRFSLHENKAEDIIKIILGEESEPKKYKGKGLNEDGERVKGFNYDKKFIEDVQWLVKKHMLYKNFSVIEDKNMKNLNELRISKKVELMENENFEKLLELWKMDALGSKPSNLDYYNGAVNIWEEYKNSKIKRQKLSDIIKDGEIMDALKEKELMINKKGIYKLGEFNIGKLTEVISGLIADKFYENIVTNKDQVLELINNIKIKEILTDTLDDINNDYEILNIQTQLKQKNIKAKEERRLRKELGRIVNIVFVTYFEKRLNDNIK